MSSEQPKGVQGLLPRGYMTRGMLSERIGRSVTIIKKMEKEGELDKFMERQQYGELSVVVYRTRDLPAIRRVAAKRAARVGWPKGRPRTSVVRHQPPPKVTRAQVMAYLSAKD